MKVIIAGGRTFTNYKKLKQVCDHFLQDQNSIEIVSGACRGADQLGEQYAKREGINSRNSLQIGINMVNQPVQNATNKWQIMQMH